MKLNHPKLFPKFNNSQMSKGEIQLCCCLKSFLDFYVKSLYWSAIADFFHFQCHIQIVYYNGSVYYIGSGVKFDDSGRSVSSIVSFFCVGCNILSFL